MSQPPWQLDQHKNQWYYVDHPNSAFVYEDGTRISFAQSNNTLQPPPGQGAPRQYAAPRTHEASGSGNYGYATGYGSALTNPYGSSSIENQTTAGMAQLSISSQDQGGNAGYVYGGPASSVAGHAGSDYARSTPTWPQNPRVSTDPELAQRGFYALGKISGVVPDKKKLFPEYRVRSKPQKFFIVGKVFKVLWPELAGQSNESITVTPESRFGEGIATKIRWFIVVKEGNNFCTCLPINTYNHQGVAKKGVVKSNHAIVYSSKEEPDTSSAEEPGPNEGDPMKPGIRVVPSKRGDKIDPKARIDFARMYTVEHNVKVYEFGDVHRDSERRLVTQWLWIIQHGAASTSGVLQPTPESAEESDSDDDEETSSEDSDEDNDKETPPGGGSAGGGGGGGKGGKGKAPATQSSSSKHGKASSSKHGKAPAPSGRSKRGHTH